jgi:tetratricopeptide (TPR) repeat protein
MSTEEVQVLKNSIGQLISMNSFLSTSVDRRLALSFLYSSTLLSNTQRVLLEIDADPQLEDVKPFANITSLSYFPGEDEVLLMLGSIFRIASIHHGSTGIWIIRLTLCRNTDHDLQAVFDHMKNQYGDGETNLISFGLALWRMGKLNAAEKYYRRVLNELPPDHVDIAGCYHNLGNVFDDKGDYELSLSWHQKALEAVIGASSLDESNIGTSLNSIAALHTKMGHYDQALEVYKKLLAIWKHSMGEDHPNVALCLRNMGAIYQKYEKFLDALECLQKALFILQKHLPAEHPQIGDLHNNIGSIQWCLDHSDLAFEHYKIALKIKQKSFPPQHPSIAMTLSNTGLVYEEKGDFQQALSYFEEAVAIYRHTVPLTHPSISHVERLIQRVSSKQKLS